MEFVPDDSILRGAESGNDVYFIHSYYEMCRDQRDILATTVYGVTFATIIGRNNLYGMQFHPGKSQMAGLHLLQNLVTG